MLQHNEVSGALAAYRSAVAAGKDEAKNYYGLALALDRAGSLSEERTALQRVMQLASSFAPAQNQLGLLSLKEGKTAEAKSELNKAINLDPRYAEARNNLGVLERREGDNTAAEQLFREAIAENSRYEQAMVNLGSLMAGEGRLAEAEEILQHAIGVDPQDADALMSHAMVLISLRRTQEALVQFRAAVRLKPKLAEAHINLGIALADANDLAGALAEFSQAVRLSPQNGLAFYNQGRVLADLERNAEAMTSLKIAVHLDGVNPDWWTMLGTVARKTGDKQAVVLGFGKASELEPGSARRHYQFGQALQDDGARDRAIAEWRRAIQLQPDYGEALYALSRVLTKTQPEEAKALQAHFLSIQSAQQRTDKAQMIGTQALSAASAGDWAQAISQLHAAIEACGECSARPLLHKNLGLVYCRSGDLVNGKRELETAQGLLPDDKDVAKTLEMLRARRAGQ